MKMCITYWKIRIFPSNILGHYKMYSIIYNSREIYFYQYKSNIETNFYYKHFILKMKNK